MCGGSLGENTIFDFILTTVEGSKMPKDIGCPNKDCVSSIVLIPRASFKNVSLRFRCSVKVTHIYPTSLASSSRLGIHLSKQAV